MADKDGPREKRGGIAGTVEAVGDSAEKVAGAVARVANTGPQQRDTLLILLAVGFLIGIFAYREVRDGRAVELREKASEDRIAALVREFNAQAELSRVNCEHTRKEDARAAAEREARIIAVFVAEGEKNRGAMAAAITAAAASEGDKNRAFLAQHLKPSPP